MTLKEFANVDSFYRDLDNGNELEWRDYMARVINKLGIENIEPYIPYDMDTLMKHFYNGDVHFNETDISAWNNAGGFVRQINRKTGKMDCTFTAYGLGNLLVRNGIRCYSPSDTVSILKETARILCERELIQ